MISDLDIEWKKAMCRIGKIFYLFFFPVRGRRGNILVLSVSFSLFVLNTHTGSLEGVKEILRSGEGPLLFTVHSFELFGFLLQNTPVFHHLKRKISAIGMRLPDVLKALHWVDPVISKGSAA